MESVLTQLAAFPATGITIKAATTSNAIQHFIRLRTDLSRAPETVVAAEPFRRALSEIWVEFDPNGSNAGGFILLIAAARRLEPLSTVESERMVAALQRIIDLTITARSATPATSTNARSASVTASPSSVANTTSTRQTRSSKRTVSTSSASTSTSPAPPATNKRIHSSTTNPPPSSKRPRTKQERTQDLDELNRNSTNKRYFDSNAPPVSAMIATAILCTVDKRATVEEILEYFTRNYSMNQLAHSWEERIQNSLNYRPHFDRIRNEEDSSTAGEYWEIIEGDFKGPLDLNGVNVHPRKRTEHSSLPPIIISIPTSSVQPRSWKDLITEAILSSPDQRMSTQQIAEYLMENYDDLRAQGSKKVKPLVSSGLSRAKFGFSRGMIATERVEMAKPTHYFHIRASKKVHPEKVGIGNEEEKGEDRIEMEEEQELSEAEQSEAEKPVKLELDKVKEEVKMEELMKVEIKEELEEDKKLIVKIKKEE